MTRQQHVNAQTEALRDEVAALTDRVADLAAQLTEVQARLASLQAVADAIPPGLTRKETHQ